MRAGRRLQGRSGRQHGRTPGSDSMDNAGLVSVDHYENFPVASWLCPPGLRPAIGAIYVFARTADDLADEGTATAAERLSDLAAFEADLQAAASGGSVSPRWREHH